MGYTVHGILQARILEWNSIFLLQGDLPNPGIEPRSPALQADALPAELGASNPVLHAGYMASSFHENS